jgi:hypothetical protein
MPTVIAQRMTAKSLTLSVRWKDRVTNCSAPKRFDGLRFGIRGGLVPTNSLC